MSYILHRQKSGTIKKKNAVHSYMLRFGIEIERRSIFQETALVIPIEMAVFPSSWTYLNRLLISPCLNLLSVRWRRCISILYGCHKDQITYCVYGSPQSLPILSNNFKYLLFLFKGQMGSNKSWLLLLWSSWSSNIIPTDHSLQRDDNCKEASSWEMNFN